MGEQIGQAWLDLVLAETEAHPLLLVLEDLHWSDPPTVRAVDAALAALESRPFAVIALARPEVNEIFPRLWAERGLQEIKLRALSAKASERLARQVLGDVDRGILDRIVKLAEGNAFYLEELIRAAHERQGEALPETVVAMVQSRLSALDDEMRRLLRAASVFGEVFWDGGLARLLGEGGGPALAPRLTDLVRRELIVRRPISRFPSEVEYAFRHALLREGAYAMLTEVDRKLGHGLAGAWLESVPGVSAERYGIIGDHFVRAEVWDNPAEAAALAEKAVAYARDFDGLHGVALARRFSGQALAALDPPRWDEAESHLAESSELFSAGEATMDLARTERAWGLVCKARGDYERARVHFDRAIALFESSDLVGELESTRAIAS
jgi:tetratricopeptide (TPR) repeat protein